MSVKIGRLHQAVAAVCPIDGVYVPTVGSSVGVRIDFKPEATAPERAAAQNVVNTFDWSDAADLTFVAQQEKAAATASVDNGAQQKGKSFERFCRAVGEVALDAINNDRSTMMAMNNAVQAATSLADLKTRFNTISFPSQVTMQQLVNAIKNKIANTPE